MNQFYDVTTVNSNELIVYDTVNDDISFFNTESDPDVNFTMEFVGEII